MSKLQVVAKGKGAFQGKLDRLRVLHPRTMAKLSGEMPSYRLGDRPEQAAWHHSNIPAVLYQTSESNLLGKSHYREVQRFRDLNPGIRFEFFDRSRRDQYMRRHWRGHFLLEIYENSLFGPMKADLFRYCILWQRGGMYCDIKSRFLLPIDEILDPSAEVVIAYENRFANVTPPAAVVSRLQHPQRLALQWALMVAPEHPMLRNVLDSIVHNAATIQDVCFEHPQAAICRFTGPGCYTQALWSWVATEHPLSGLQQAGIDFEGCAEYSMPGAWSRWALNPHYSLAEHSLILKSAAA